VRRALAALLIAAVQPAAAKECSVALVLALDVSASVDAGEYALQMEGLAAALRHPEVLAAILPYEGAGIMATAFAWSGFQHQEVILPWTWLGSEAAVDAFAAGLVAAQRRHDYWPTALGRAMAFAANLHRQNPEPCNRPVVDVSGDGVNNDGVEPAWHRARGTFEGLTINGLVIRGAVPDPVEHYRAQVLHGPGAFLEVADGFEDYPPAILRKLLRELQPVTGRAD
jgi:hypothetical protein